MTLVKLDIQARYKRTWLGAGWSLVQPLALTAILCFVFSTIFGFSLRDYASYVISGLLVWTFLTGVIGEGCSSMIEGETYIRSRPLPLAVHPLRVTLRVAFHSLLLLLVTLGITWYFRGFENLPALLALIPGSLLLLLFGWSAGIILGVATVYFRDISHLSQISLQFLFYLTPIIYPKEVIEGRGFVSSILDYNFAVHFVNLLREPILNNRFPSWHTYSISAIVVICCLLLSIVLLVRNEKKLVFHL